MPLNAAHKGYLYQDLATAYFFTYAMIFRQKEITVDKKEHSYDRFDDVTINTGNRVVKYQFKFIEDPTKRLEKSDFTSDRKDLRIDLLVESYLNTNNSVQEFRLCSTWLPPNDELLACILLMETEPTFQKSLTKLYCLNSDIIWPENKIPIWRCLRVNQNIKREDFVEFCSRFVIELETPQASHDLTRPGPLELSLFELLEQGIGIGKYPNQNRNVIDVAANLINLASKARAGTESLSTTHIEKSLELRTDFGRVSQQFPIDRGLLVDRSSIYSDIISKIKNKKLLILTGEPGSGKSWIINRTAEELIKSGYTVAKHYCYLEPGDPEVQSRITSNVLFANLIYELLDAVPELVEVHRPIYSAGPRELENLLQQAVKIEDFKGLCLIIDGLDHITRVLSESTNISANDANIIEQLCSLQVPDEVCMVISSQPGHHLNVIRNKATTISVPPWNLPEVQRLVDQTGCIDMLKNAGFNDTVDNFLHTLYERSEGNPLYVTFLCKQLLSLLNTGIINPISWVEELPQLERDISNYYDYLLRTADPSSRIIAEFLGLIDFGVTEQELQEIYPLLAHHIHGWLNHLSPIIKQVTAQGGIRIYHESFRRFIVERLNKTGVPIPNVITPVIDWLYSRGFYNDAKAYRFLLTCLRRAGKEEDILILVDKFFLNKSVAAGHPRRAIEANLNIALDVAKQSLNWPVLVRINEIYRAMVTCFEEKMHDLTDYSIAFASIFGEKSLVERLLFDGQPTYSGKEGLLLCSLCESAGIAAPWSEYLERYQNEFSTNQTEDESRDIEISVAKFRGIMRTEGFQKIELPFKEWLLKNKDPDYDYLSSVFKIIIDDNGHSIINNFFEDENMPEVVRNIAGISLAEFLYSQEKNEEVNNIINQLLSLKNYVSATFLFKCHELGFDLSSVKSRFPDVNQFDIGLTADRRSPKTEDIREWVSLIGILAAVNDDKLKNIESKIQGVGWYRAWLRFVLELSRAEQIARLGHEITAGEIVSGALKDLSLEDNPFLGKPRACDLYQIHSIVHETFCRAMKLLKFEQWENALLILLKISKNSTTYLQNTPSGPITPLALAEMLIPYSAESSINRNIIEAIEQLVDYVGKVGEFYENHAVLDMILARAYKSAGRNDESLRRWESMSVYLCGYGFHKDITIFELIDSIPTLGVLDIERMKSFIEKLHPIVDKIVEHTDGKETKHAYNSFYKGLCSVDVVGALNLLAKSLSLWGGKIDWRLESAMNFILGELHQDIDPFINFILLCTLPLEDETDALEKRLNKIKLISEKDRSLGDLCYQILAAQVEGDRPKVNNESLRILKNFAAEFKFQFPQIESLPEPKNDLDYPGSRFNEGQKGKVSSNMPIFNAVFSLQDIMNGIRANRKSFLLHHVMDDHMLNAFGYRLILLLEDDKEKEALQLLHYFAEEYDSFDGRHLYELANGLKRYQHSNAAAVALTLAYAYTRSHGGWLMLGGIECEPWLQEAITLSSDYAYTTLSNVIGNFIKFKGRYNGITQNLCEFFARCGEKNIAFDIWNEAFLIIQQRVPGTGEKTIGPFIPYKTTEVPRWTMLEGAIALLISRINHPELKRKTAAIAGFITIIKEYPLYIGNALKSVMSVDMPLTSTTLLLKALLYNEENPYLISHTLKDELKSSINIEHYGIRQVTYELLKRIDPTINPQEIQRSYPLNIILPSNRERAILTLDWGERIETICESNPDFGAIVAYQFHKIVEGGNKTYKGRIESRYKAAKDNVRKNYPATPFLLWETELFESVFHMVFNGLNQSLDLEYFIPRIQDHVLLWYSRTHRPQTTLPSEQIVGYFQDEIQTCKDEYIGWVRVAIFEEQLLMEDGVLSDVTGRATVIAGLVFPGGVERDEFIGEIPLGKGDISPWWHINFNNPVDNRHYYGPLVGMEIVDDFLGFQKFLILPSFLISQLGLHPTSFPGRMELIDNVGNSAVVFRQWSLRPAGEEIDLETPTLKGGDLIVRPDIFSQIVFLCRNEPVFIKHVTRH